MSQGLLSVKFAGIALILVAPATSFAQRNGKMIRSGAVAPNKTYEVNVSGGTKMKVGDLADLAFRESRQRNAQFAQASTALLGQPINEESFTENENATTLESTSKVTIVDPEAFRRLAPAFRSLNSGMKDRGDFSVSKLKPEAKRGFDAFKAEVANYPATHPLKIAAKGGDDALLDAIASGKGDVTIRTKVVVPKTEVLISGRTAQVPKTIDGALDYSQKESKQYKFVPNMSVNAQSVVTYPEQSSETTVAKFLTGFTKHQAFDWEERWEFGTHDYFSIGVHAGYALGLRVPVEVTAKLSPMTLTHSGPTDTSGKYNVTVSARALNGDESFYKDVGLPSSDVFEGKEFVLEADAYASVDVVAGWGTIKIHEKVPGNANFDFGQQFKPPYGDCGTSCGVDIWVPAVATRTQLSILGIVTGSAQIGFNLSGDGKVGVDYTSIVGSGEVDSTLVNPLRTHSLSFSGSGQKILSTVAPASPFPGLTKYGFKLSNPSYDWTLVATPGVKGTVSVNARPFFSLEEVIGPYWLNPFAMRLGTVHLSGHEGTKRSIVMKGGEKTFRKDSSYNPAIAPSSMGTVRVEMAK